MRHFGTGFGLVGEHGAESIHAELNLLAATFDAVPKSWIFWQSLRSSTEYTHYYDTWRKYYNRKLERERPGMGITEDENDKQVN